MEDKELIRRIQNGQKEYLNVIAEKYYDDIYYFCCYQCGSREDAFDLAQETFLRFIRYVEKYQYRNLKGYLLTIAMNLCREYLQETADRKKRQCLEVSVSRENEGHGGEAGYREVLEYRTRSGPPRASDTESAESICLLTEALLKLPDIQREAVLLHHFYGYKNREIARMTGVSCDAVKSRVRQGLEKLGRLLDAEDF